MMIAALLALAAPAAADVPFSPDRPGYADSPSAVPAGHLMAEAGVQLSAQAGLAAVEAPQLLLRGGLTDWLELRLAAPSAVVLPGEGVALGSTAAGAKCAAALGDAAVSVVGMVPFAGGQGAGLGSPSFSANAARRVGVVGLTANATAAPGDVLGWAASLAAGYRAFFAQAAVEGAGEARSALVGAGAAITPAEALQLDVFVDLRPADGAVSVGAGIARQW